MPSEIHESAGPGTPGGASQEFLDNNQYTLNGILRYEWIFGDSFISTGGLETTENFCQGLELTPSTKVLDVGCGIGGSSFYMAEKFGAEVLGVDLSRNMLGIAQSKLNNKPQDIKDKVTFCLTDITKHDYAENSFDVIYSRDALIHIPEKKKLIGLFYKWLAPGGKLLISDYCEGDHQLTEEFLKYKRQRGYDLQTVQVYGKIVKDAGFSVVHADDVTDMFEDVLRKELARFAVTKNEFIKKFSIKDYTDIVDGWEQKLVRSATGDHKWGLFRAIK